MKLIPIIIPISKYGCNPVNLNELYEAIISNRYKEILINPQHILYVEKSKSPDNSPFPHHPGVISIHIKNGPHMWVREDQYEKFENIEF